MFFVLFYFREMIIQIFRIIENVLGMYIYRRDDAPCLVFLP